MDCHNFLVSMYHNIDRLRAERGISLEQLSKDTGIPIKRFKELRNGIENKKFHAHHIIILFTYFEVSPSELLDEKESDN